MRGMWTIAVVTALVTGGCIGDDSTTAATSGEGTTEATGSGTAATGATTGTMGTTGTTADEPTTGIGTGSTSSATTPTTGVAPECQSAADCPPAATCQEATCEAGVCGTANLPEGTFVADLPGDCRMTVCDGAGGTKEIPSDDPPGQVAGDCKIVGCLQGQVEYVPADDDLPNDDNECTVDSCSAGQPVFTPKPVNSLCGPMGMYFCHSDASCRKCKEVTEACEDYGPEPHETQQAAYSLGQITDADSSGSYVCGTIVGADDVDWYQYSGYDALFNQVDPTRTLVAESDAGRLCVYLQCDKGGTTVVCDAKDTPDTAPMGQQGCCGTGTVSPYLDCGGLDDSATVWIRVDNPDGLACIPYRVDYHY